jgi:hypothetical protein
MQVGNPTDSLIGVGEYVIKHSQTTPEGVTQHYNPTQVVSVDPLNKAVTGADGKTYSIHEVSKCTRTGKIGANGMPDVITGVRMNGASRKSRRRRNKRKNKTNKRRRN